MKTKDRMEERRKDGRSNRGKKEGRAEGREGENRTKYVWFRVTSVRVRFGNARSPLEERSRLQLS